MELGSLCYFSHQNSTTFTDHNHKNLLATFFFVIKSFHQHQEKKIILRNSHHKSKEAIRTNLSVTKSKGMIPDSIYNKRKDITVYQSAINRTNMQVGRQVGSAMDNLTPNPDPDANNYKQLNMSCIYTTGNSVTVRSREGKDDGTIY